MFNNYTEIIDELYIKPLKNVLVIDDEYPTFKDLSLKGTDKGKVFSEEKKAIELFDYFRENGFNFDVENSTQRIDAIPNHLTSSELLVLDYHLNPVDGTDGTDARKLIEQLAKTPHENFVIVNTKGNDGDIISVAAEIMISLTIEKTIDPDIMPIIAEIEDTIPSFSKILIDAINNADLINYLSDCNLIQRNFPYFMTAYNNIVNQYRDTPHIKCKRKAIYDYLFNTKINRMNISRGEFTSVRAEKLEEFIWIEAVNVFVIVSKKEADSVDFLKLIKNALIAKKPTPVDLLLTNIQNNILEYGSAYSRNLFNNQIAGSWYLHAAKGNCRDESLKRVTESVLETFNVSVLNNSFVRSDEIIQMFGKTPYSEILNEYFNISIDDVADEDILYAWLNAFFASKTPEQFSNHLTTGSVIKIGDDYWVVLHNSCDLVPTQKNGWNKEIDPLRPFNAVKMIPKDSAPALAKMFRKDGDDTSELITNCEYIAILTVAKPLIFLMNKIGKSPYMSVFYADSNGEITDKKGTCKEVVVKKESIDECMTYQAEIKTHKFELVGQLRYEYATRFLNKLAAHLSRVGVDYFDNVTR